MRAELGGGAKTTKGCCEIQPSAGVEKPHPSGSTLNNPFNFHHNPLALCGGKDVFPREHSSCRYGDLVLRVPVVFAGARFAVKS